MLIIPNPGVKHFPKHFRWGGQSPARRSSNAIHGAHGLSRHSQATAEVTLLALALIISRNWYGFSEVDRINALPAQPRWC